MRPFLPVSPCQPQSSGRSCSTGCASVRTTPSSRPGWLTRCVSLTRYSSLALVDRVRGAALVHWLARWRAADILAGPGPDTVRGGQATACRGLGEDAAREQTGTRASQRGGRRQGGTIAARNERGADRPRRRPGHRSVPRERTGGMVSSPRQVTLLGSTGSIGRQAIAVAQQNPERLEITGLAAGGGDVGLLAEQALALGVRTVAVARATAAQDLQLAFYAAASQRGWCEGRVLPAGDPRRTAGGRGARRPPRRRRPQRHHRLDRAAARRCPRWPPGARWRWRTRSR